MDSSTTKQGHSASAAPDIPKATGPYQHDEDDARDPQPVYETQDGLAPHPITSQPSGLVSPSSEQGDGIHRYEYARQQSGTVISSMSPPPSEAQWTSSPNNKDNTYHGQPSVVETTASDAPAHPNLTNRPAGMTPREAAEKREAEILGHGPKPNYDQSALPVGHVVPLTALRDKAMPVDCPGCHRMVTTQVDKHVSDRGTMWAVILCLCCGIIFFWIPLVMDEFKDTEHRCPNCRVVLAAVDSEGRHTHTYSGPVRAQPSAYQHPQYQPQAQNQPQEKHEYSHGQTSGTVVNATSSPQEVAADETTEVRGKVTGVHELDTDAVDNKKK